MAPKVSIFTTCKNAEEFFCETIDSILLQTFKDIEIVIVDAESTDGTLALIKAYAEKDARIRWISEKDRDALEGFSKAINLCQGKYIMCLPISDFYLSKTWIQTCVDAMDSDIETSMVHGCPVLVSEKGSIEGLAFPEWSIKPLPSKEEFTKFYFATFCYVSELTYCIRREIFMKCFPLNTDNANLDFELNGKDQLSDELHDPFLVMLFNFFSQGYLARYMPHLAAAGRVHQNSRSKKFEKYLELNGHRYTQSIVNFRKKILTQEKIFIFRDGLSREIGKIDDSTREKFARDIFNYRLRGRPMFNYRESLGFRILKKVYRLWSRFV